MAPLLVPWVLTVIPDRGADDLGLEGERVALHDRLARLLDLLLVRLDVAAREAVAVLAKAPCGKALAIELEALGLFAVAAGQWLRVVSVITTQRGLVRPILSEILLRVQRLVYL